MSQYIHLPCAIALLVAVGWTTLFSFTNKPGIRGLRNLGILAGYILVLVFLFVAGWRAALGTWAVFRVAGGLIYVSWEVLQRLRTAAGEQRPEVSLSPLLQGLLAWPIMVPEAVEYALAELGVLPVPPAQAASPNGGPAKPSRNPGAAEGPPSVSESFGVIWSRLSKIVAVRVALIESGAKWLSVRCLSGRAKWSPESRVFSLKADICDDEAQNKWSDFLASKPLLFRMEVDYQSGASPEQVSTSSFSKCREATLELRSATLRPTGASTTQYYLKTIAELDDPPNGGPAARYGNSGVTGGPPSVS